MSFQELKYGLAVGGFIGLVAMTMIAGAEHADIVSQKATIARNGDCIAALTGKGGGRNVVGSCDPAIILYYDRAQHADTCDQALAQGGTAPECSAAVADLYGSYVTVRAQLQSTVADRDAAISRAAKLAATQATRKAQDDQALAAAPRLPDGLIVCDAQCLRNRFEAAGD